MTKASEPEEIKWENLGVSMQSRCGRRACVWLFALLVLLSALIGLVQFKVNSDNEIEHGYNTDYNCPV